MERRDVIKNMFTVGASSLVLPNWALGWNINDLRNVTFDDEALMKTLVETIIPTTDTLGAGAIGVHLLVKKIVTDCFEPTKRDSFFKTPPTINQISNTLSKKDFVDCDDSQRISVLKLMAASKNQDLVEFYNTLRKLTIRGYMNSEYVMTKLTNYEMAPARFYGSVKINNK
jgi:hypothetical protein